MIASTHPDTGADELLQYALDDRYRRDHGRVYLNGSQALVRLPIMQHQLDVKNELNTAGFISGYTGSPLGGYDIALKNAEKVLQENHIHFQPGVNEDLGATAVWGTQQIDIVGQAKYDGVFGIWYGKGPGLDRSGDALKHGSYSGAAKHGGVLVLAGDDHGAKSSTIAHQSDHAFVHFGMPFLNPSSVQDYLDFGLYGIAMSRYSGCWVGMKCVTDTIESSASVSVDIEDFQINFPEQDDASTGTLNSGPAIPAKAAELRQYRQRIPALQAFVRANGLDRNIVQGESRRLAIVTTGKAYLDVMQALEELGIGLEQCLELGIGVYKVAMPWPLEPQGVLEFVEGYQEILVVEEKRPIIEDQLARLLVNLPKSANLLGKFNERGEALLSAEGELDPYSVAHAIGARLRTLMPELFPECRLNEFERSVEPTAVKATALARMPSFCAGCPHNTSTKVPEGSMAFGGIGCHGMATFLPERRTPTLFHMGGEGASWIGISPFTETKHIFQNLGDGTYYHSGLLAIRAAVAAGVNITYKILVNDSIAMTGGQEIEGKVSVDRLSRQLDAEGVKRIALVGNNLEQYKKFLPSFAAGVSIHHRDQLEQVQQELREWAGVSAIIYDQHCATELRRRRKRGTAEDPDQRIFINQRVCEGCGDCSVQSNCIAIEPVETNFGRKRKINQSVCNKDFSCVKGYCPSFVSVYGGTLKKRGMENSDNSASVDVHALVAKLSPPPVLDSTEAFSILITGIGGTGVVTLGSLIGMAAFLEGKGCTVLDVAGLAQRNGAVTSHIRVANDPDKLYATRIARADLIIGCDIVVASGAEVLGKMRQDHTHAVVNSRVAPTSDFATNPDLNLSAEDMIAAISAAVGEQAAAFIESSQFASVLMGNEVASNMFLVGFALQKGWMPVGLAAIERAIELNGVAIAMNKTSLAWGRLAASDLAAVEAAAAPAPVVSAVEVFQPETLAGIMERNSAELVAYQNTAYAERYRNLLNKVLESERLNPQGGERLSLAVAKYYFKLLAYKDEYEVARLHSDEAFVRSLNDTFSGDFKLAFHLAPPVLLGRDSHTGRYPKRVFGAWILPVFGILAKFKFLRGTPLDVFGYAHHRRAERALITQYEHQIESLLGDLTPGNYSLAVDIASLPEFIRGYDTVKDISVEESSLRQKTLMSQFKQAKNAQPEKDKIIALELS